MRTRNPALTGDDRTAVAEDLAALYRAGSSIRDIAQRTGRSYGVVHDLLTEAGTQFRDNSGQPRKPTALPEQQRTPQTEPPLTGATDGQRAWNDAYRGFQPRRHEPPKLTPQQRDEITQRLAGGEMPKTLALEYGVSAGRIRELR